MKALIIKKPWIDYILNGKFVEAKPTLEDK